MAAAYLDISRVGVLSIAGNATLEAHGAYLYQPAAMIGNIQNVLYDQVRNRKRRPVKGMYGHQAIN